MSTLTAVEQITSVAEIKTLAMTLMVENKLFDWYIDLNQERSRIGVCYYSTRTISLSEPILTRNPISVARDTILHEIAHAKTEGDGHGLRWKATALAIGCSAHRCANASSLKLPQAKWTGRCSRCGNECSRNRLTAGMRNTAYCVLCFNKFGGKTADHRIVWTKNY